MYIYTCVHCLICIFIAWMTNLEAATAHETTPSKSIGASRGSYEINGLDPYALKITTMFENGNNVFIYLNDGSVWQHIHANPSRLGWLLGDEVRLDKGSAAWKMDNMTYNSNVLVQFVRLNNDSLPIIQSIKDAGGSLVLEDGSEWKISWWNRQRGQTWKWKSGDRVIISPLELPSEHASHLIINYDKGMLSTLALLIRKPL